MRTVSILGLAAWLLAGPAVRGADWPQWRGPKRDGHSPEKGLLKEWPRGGPKLVWTFDKAGTGYAGPAVVGGRLYTMGARGDTEYVFALDSKGKELWSARIGPMFTFPTNTWSGGPNATPSVDGDLVYALGSQGILVCVDREGGKERWRKDLVKDLEGEVNNVGGAPAKMGWGYSWSPLVDGDHLLCTPGGPGGLFAALDKKSGEVVWRSKEVKDQATYSSPIVAEIEGVRQYIALTPKGVAAVAARDGSRLWYYEREDPWPDVICPTPICKGNLVYATAWGGCELIKVTAAGGKFKTEAVYSEKEIGNRQGGVVLVGDYVYGYNETRAWECQEFQKGEIKWESEREGLPAGSLIYADDRLYCLSEIRKKGVVGLLDASPEGYKERGRFTLPRASALRKLHGGVWTPPVIADGYLYLRDQELIFCYKVK